MIIIVQFQVKYTQFVQYSIHSSCIRKSCHFKTGVKWLISCMTFIHTYTVYEYNYISSLYTKHREFNIKSLHELNMSKWFGEKYSISQ